MKRFSTAMAVVSMINMAAVAGLTTLAWSRGWLDKDRVQRAIAVLQGREPLAATTSESEKDPSADVATASDRIRRNREQDEILRTELDRRRREIQNAWELLERQQLVFVREKEEFEARQARHREELDRRAQEAGESGFQKELEILSELKPKEAKELLRLKDEADVVRILMEMEPRKARKIVGECKQSEERLWIGRIFEKMHDRDATQAEVLAAGN